MRYFWILLPILLLFVCCTPNYSSVPSISFANPTPENGTKLNTSSIYVNITSNDVNSQTNQTPTVLPLIKTNYSVNKTNFMNLDDPIWKELLKKLNKTVPTYAGSYSKTHSWSFWWGSSASDNGNEKSLIISPLEKVS